MLVKQDKTKDALAKHDEAPLETALRCNGSGTYSLRVGGGDINRLVKEDPDVADERDHARRLHY